MKGNSPMSRLFLRVAFALAVVTFATAARAQDWLLNAGASRFYMQTAKANAIIETHQFNGLDGFVKANGDAQARVDLISVASGVDVRDVRMRFLLFETYKYAYAEATAKLDMAEFQRLLTNTRMLYFLKFTLNLHGISKAFEVPVTITRLSDKSVSVATARPIVVAGDDFGFLPGIAKLSEAVSGLPIVQAASISFDLLFETGDKLPEHEAASAEAERRKTVAETAAISTEMCATRFGVISMAQAVYFRTGSSEIDSVSEPLLASVADIAKRCPAVRVDVSGHTDNAGAKAANQQLSEQRAKAVMAALVRHGVAATRIDAAGFGDARPIAPNTTEANRAKNRRIEFRVK